MNPDSEEEMKKIKLHGLCIWALECFRRKTFAKNFMNFLIMTNWIKSGLEDNSLTSAASMNHVVETVKWRLRWRTKSKRTAYLPVF